MPEATEEIEITVDASDMIKQKFGLVIRVKNYKKTALRFRASTFFLWLARWFWPCELFLIETAVINPECGCACGDVEPYGFVPEDGCPVHDADDIDDRLVDGLEPDDGFDIYRYLIASENEQDD
jgi:hypothetical protein